VRLEVASRVESIAVVRSALDELLARHGVGEAARERLVLGVGEAVANAITHGNGSQPERLVVVDVALDGGALTVEVGDDGAGFDPAAVADPRRPERLLETGGRGVLFMRAAFDDVTCSARPGGGSVVRLRARLAARSKSYT
jgi:anti-sigma regulatory factor (Ser/Thr protein kinase)